MTAIATRAPRTTDGTLHPDVWLDMCGKPYMEGARGPDAYDCFGVVLEVLRRLGVEVVGVAVDRADEWDRVAGEPQPGDVFIASISGEFHVGVCLGGDMMLHAAARGGAVAVGWLSTFRRAGALRGIVRHAGSTAIPVVAPSATDALIVWLPDMLTDPLRREVRRVPCVGTVGDHAPEGANVAILPDGVPRRLSVVADAPLPEGGSVIYARVPSGTELVVGLILAVISLALQLALAPSAPKPRKERDESSPTFDLGGIRNTAAVGVVQPVVYGEHRVGGNFISVFQRVDEQGRAILYAMILLSRGPIHSIAGLTADQDELTGDNIPATIEIDGNAAKNYNCAVSVRLGASDQTEMPGFRESVVSYSQSITLLVGSPFTYTTAGAVEAFEIIVGYPLGLFNISPGGNVASRSVNITIRHRVKGTTTWTTDLWTNLAARRGAVNFQFNKRGLTKDYYEIQIERTAPAWPETATDKESRSDVTSINEITLDALAYPGCALLGMRIVSTDQLGGSIPTITATIKGRKVWIWDGVSETSPDFGTAETWSDNPAWCALDMLINPHYGLGRSGRLTLNNVSLSDFKAWADLCDTSVDDGRSGTTQRARCDLVVDAAVAGFDLVQSIGLSSWARLYIGSNKVRCYLEKAVSAPLFLFSAGNTRDVSIQYVGRRSRPNAVEIQYPNEETNYDQDTAPKFDDTAILTNAEPVSKETLQAVGVTRAAQAYRLAQWRLLNHKLVKRRFTWTSGPESIHLLPGDVTALHSPAMNVGASGRLLAATSTTVTLDQDVTIGGTRSQVAVITSADSYQAKYIPAGTYTRGSAITVTDSGGGATTWSPVPAAGDKWAVGALAANTAPVYVRTRKIETDKDLTRRFEGDEYVAAVYSDDPGTVETFTDALPNARGIPTSAANLKLTETATTAADGSVCDGIVVQFDPSSQWDRAEVWYRAADLGGTDEAGWRFWGWSRGDAMIAPLAGGYAYDVAVVAVGAGGTRQRIGKATRGAVFIRGRRAVPTAPASVAATITGGILSVAITQTTADAMIAGYRIVYGDSFVGGMVLARLASTQWSAPCPFFGAQTIRVRSVTRYGVLSDTEVTAAVTGDLGESVHVKDADVSEETGWAGSKTNLAVSGGEIAFSGSSLTGRVNGTQTASVITKEKQRVTLTARCKIADVALTWDDCAFSWGSAKATVATWATSYLDGREIQDGLTWAQAGFAWASLPATLSTWAGPPDIISGLEPTLAYDVNTGGGYSGSFTNYAGPFDVDNLIGIQSRLSLARPHASYDPRGVTLRAVTHAYANADPVIRCFEWLDTQALAAGSRRDGFVNSTANNPALLVPTGKKLVVTAIDGNITAGATAGTYTVHAGIYNVTDSTKVAAVTATGTANADIRLTGEWTRVSAVCTLAAGKEYKLYYDNDATSPGALANVTHHVCLTAILEDV